MNNAEKKAAKLTKEKAANSLRDATLKEGREAGYTVPNSAVEPTFVGNRLESLGGKAAIKQESTARNQTVTNDLTKKALGITDDMPISQGALDKLRETAGKTYQEVSGLSPQASADLEALKVARNEAQGWFNAYNRSARPDDLAKAKAARTLSDELESSLEQHALAAERQDLVPALREARKQIAKTYTVERALNKATGEINAAVFGRLYDKGKPLSDGLETIGKFHQAFPTFMGKGSTNPAAGVSKMEQLAMGLLGTVGAGAMGPAGVSMAALPLTSHLARSAALSKTLQKTPNYDLGLTTKSLSKMPPETIQLLARTLANY